MNPFDYDAPHTPIPQEPRCCWEKWPLPTWCTEPVTLHGLPIVFTERLPKLTNVECGEITLVPLEVILEAGVHIEDYCRRPFFFGGQVHWEELEE